MMKGTGKEGQKHGPHEKMEEAPMESLSEGWHKKGEPHIWMEGGKIPKRIPRLKVRSLEEDEQFEIDSFGIPVGGGSDPTPGCASHAVLANSPSQKMSGPCLKKCKGHGIKNLEAMCKKSTGHV